VGQVRFHHRLRFTLGVARMAARAIGVYGFREIKSELGELAQYVELSRMALGSMLAEAAPTEYGLWAPASTLAMDTFATQISGRLTEILVKICGSGAVMQAAEGDFAALDLAVLIRRYMSGSGVDAEEKAMIFALVRNLVCSDFGARQHIYEMWNRGDPVRNRMSLIDSLSGLDELEADIRAEFQFGAGVSA
jgi:aromatic ring hydroxylase